MKIVINTCFGSFRLSEKAAEDLGCKPCAYNDIYMRTAPELIKLIEEKGSEYCSDFISQLKVVEIPDDVDWYISNDDGMETIEEVHRNWS